MITAGLLLAALMLPCGVGAAVLQQPGLAAGDEHALVVATDGSVWSWGLNGSGQLGDGTLAQSSAPVAVVVPGGASAVAAGVDFSLALAQDGTVWAWGANDSGQLGNGTTTDSPSPVQVLGPVAVVAIAAGDYHGVALGADGTVWTWGDNRAGQLADGTITNRSTPVTVGGLGSVSAIEAGGYFTLALQTGGGLLGWGQNDFGQLGDGTTDERHAPVTVALDGVSAIAAGYRHSLALRADGTIWAWGFNDSGQLGDGLAIDPAAFVSLPQPVSGLSGGTRVAAGAYHSLAALDDGTVRTWGWNGNGQLGDGTTGDSSVPVTVVGSAPPLLLSGGLYSSVLLDTAGQVQAWGANDFGQLGDGTTGESHVPVAVALAESLFNGPYLVTPQAGSGGSMSPATVQTVAQGTTTSFDLLPLALYEIATVSGCGGTLSGATYTTAAIYADCTVTATFAPIDSDADGVVDLNDNCPAVANANQSNYDLDSLGDACDPDDDDDTVADGLDAFPLNAAEWLDTDLDGNGNNADLDDDGDGWSDSDEGGCGSDALLASSLPLDTDSDHLCNVVDPDIDGDGFANGGDAFPLDGGEWLDSDLDGSGDNADLDDDNDGIADTIEIAAGTDPLNPDVTPPLLTLSAPTDGTATNQATLNVSGQAGDETSLVAVLVNGVAVTVAGDGSFSTALTLGEGGNLIVVTAIDAAGNRTTAPTRTVTLDSVLPTITVTTPADNSQSAVATIALNGSLSEAATLDARLNSGSWQAVAQNGLTFADSLLLVEGSNTIELRAVDLLQNVTTLARTVLLDSNAPSLAVTTPNADTTVHYPQLTVQGTVSDALTAVTLAVTVNGAPAPATVSGSDFSVDLTLAAAGTYLVSVTATDELGNSAAATRNIIYAPYPSGDADNDGTLTAADALWTLQQAVGLRALQPGDLGRGDVAPLLGGKPQPDGKISAIDALAILRKVVGLESW